MFLKNGVGTAEGGNDPAVDHAGQSGAIVVSQRGIEKGAFLTGIIQKGDQTIALDRVFHPQDTVGDDFLLFVEEKVPEKRPQYLQQPEQDDMLLQKSLAQEYRTHLQQRAGSEVEKGGGNRIEFARPGRFEVLVIQSLKEIGQRFHGM